MICRWVIWLTALTRTTNKLKSGSLVLLAAAEGLKTIFDAATGGHIGLCIVLVYGHNSKLHGHQTVTRCRWFLVELRSPQDLNTFVGCLASPSAPPRLERIQIYLALAYSRSGISYAICGYLLITNVPPSIRHDHPTFLRTSLTMSRYQVSCPDSAEGPRWENIDRATLGWWALGLSLQRLRVLRCYHALY